MAFKFAVGGSSGSERGTPGYDVTSPFMSGLKENMGSIVPLALNATALKMDEEKANAILGLRKEELARQLETTRRQTIESQLKTMLAVASEAKDQAMMPGVAAKFKELTGTDYPMRTVAPDITSPANVRMLDQGLTLPEPKKEYFIPQTGQEKALEVLGEKYNWMLRNQDELNKFKLDFLSRQQQGKEELTRMAAVLKAATGGAQESWHDSGRTDDDGYPILVSNRGNMKRGDMLAGKKPGKDKAVDTEKLNSTIVLNNDNWQVVAPMAENFNKNAPNASWSFWEGDKGGVVKIAYGVDSKGNTITNADIWAEAKRSGKSFGDVVGQLQKRGMAQYVEMPKPAKK